MGQGRHHPARLMCCTTSNKCTSQVCRRAGASMRKIVGCLTDIASLITCGLRSAVWCAFGRDRASPTRTRTRIWLVVKMLHLGDSGLSGSTEALIAFPAGAYWAGPQVPTSPGDQTTIRRRPVGCADPNHIPVQYHVLRGFVLLCSLHYTVASYCDCACGCACDPTVPGREPLPFGNTRGYCSRLAMYFPIKNGFGVSPSVKSRIIPIAVI